MDQLEDRIHRIGQRESVNIWYLLAEQTIEEDIAQIIDGLRIGVDAATEGEGRDESPSIMVELLERMAARAAIT
jgi:SNF2 family DNA or RNA helicase